MTTAIDPIVDTETITSGQLGKMNDSFTALCRKNAVSLPKDATQLVLEYEGDQLAQEMFEALRKRVKRRSGMIIRRVTVNRDQTPKELVDATGRVQYIDSKVLNTMSSQGAGTEEVDLYFFNVRRYISIDEQEKELAAMGLEPDYYAQTQLNIDDQSFADEHPNGAQWDNKDGRASYITFDRVGDKRYVICRRNDYDWDGFWWFAGRRPRK